MTRPSFELLRPLAAGTIAALIFEFSRTQFWKGISLKISVLTAFVASLLVVASPAAPAGGQQRTIEIHAKRFAFSPAEIEVKMGETITLSLISDDVPHSLLIEGLGVNVAIAKGHANQVQITPTKTGDFPGRCGRFCGSGHGQMRFVVHVTG
jgi:cytochrome c oxidase subunit 2